MKRFVFVLLPVILISFTADQCSAQLKGLGKRIQRKVEDRVNKRFDQATDLGLDKVEQGVGETVTGGDEDPQTDQVPQEAANPGTTAVDGTTGAQTTGTVAESSTANFAVNTKFDYVPGEQLMVFDDFSEDAVGDFPARWNTNGTGEVVTLGDSDDKWFQIRSGSDYIPDLPNELPEEYTIEFDLATRGLDQKTASSTLLEIFLDDNNTFNQGKNFITTRIPFCQYHPVGFRVRNVVNGKSVINNQLDGDIRQQVLNLPHISIAVNKTRFRLWVNETKYIDVPRLVPTGNTIKYLKFRPYYFKDGKEDIFIRNLKIAEGGLDLRGQLLRDGMVSTNGILFDVNSANIQPESYGVLRQIALAMQEESGMKLNIIGHTDSDGNDQENLSLSQRRAEAVKSSLVNDFNISADRLSVAGKGEAEPVAENDSPEGKAANRRVEFVSL